MYVIGKENIRFAFDPAAAPVLTVESGATVRFHTQDCYAEQIDADGKDFALLDMTRNNPVTGPLFVTGAEAGDVLKVEVLDIVPEDHGVMCLRPSRGLYDVAGCHCRRFPLREGKAIFDHGLEIPLRPMIGVIGTCPAEGGDTKTPGPNGGNMDIRDLGPGSTVYLPVSVPGALLSIGDCHARQGDGETAICGLEVSAAVTVRVSVCWEAGNIPTPFIETSEAVYTVWAAPTLDEAGETAARRMHRYLTETTRLTDAQAAMLLSLVGDLRISQVVNPRRGCVMRFPKEYLDRIRG